MRDRIVLITGATGGIGKVTAEALARQGASLVLFGRDRERTERVVDELRSATGNTAVRSVIGDLASLDSIRRAAEEFRRDHDRLDVLVHNAGAIYQRRELTVDGYELTFAANHLGPFLLTHLLRDRLEASAAARVVTVASEAGRLGRLHFDDLMCERRYAPYRAYNQSKLANIAFAFQLAERLKGTRVTSNSLHPGVIATGFGLNREGWLKTLVKLASPFLISPEQGAQTSIHLASSPEVEGVTGKYFIKSRPRRPPAAALNAENQRRLWEVSEKLVGIA